MTSYHAVDRLQGRLSDSDRAAVLRRMAELEDTRLSRKHSAACLLGRSSQYASGGSEGRLIVGIWRGYWVTVMLRREGQGLDRRELRVDRIVTY